VPIVGNEKAVEIKIKAVPHRRTVDLGDEPACLGQGATVKSDAIPDGDELVRRLS
jgi:hypothetical protein